MIELCNLNKTYGTQVILEDVNFQFPNTGLYCLVGASGAGKSTLFNLLAGFDTSYTGSILIHQENLNTMSEPELCNYRRDHIGFIFQNYSLLFGYSVMENILLACDASGSDTKKQERKALDLLERLHLLDKAQEKVENLSGGQKQRVAIARALITEPSIILADEPTGALDRRNASQIMRILKEVAKECFVLVITHDQKICEFADSTLTIHNKKLVGEHVTSITNASEFIQKDMAVKATAGKYARKNFCIHRLRFCAISFAIALGILLFILSISSRNFMSDAITDFKEKNIAFHNGYIKVEDNSDAVFDRLIKEERVNEVFKQYMLADVSLMFNDQEVNILEKYPMPKAMEKMSYGTLPQAGENQISLSPSLAKKLDYDIINLIGKEITLQYQDYRVVLTICGIGNASYDDFFVSSDIEKHLYSLLENPSPYALSYDVINFEDIPKVHQELVAQGLPVQSASDDVSALQATFQQLQHLFLVISLLILSIALGVSALLLVKLQHTRFREVGLLSALGFSKQHIQRMFLYEAALLSFLTIVFNLMLIVVTYVVCLNFTFDFSISLSQILGSILASSSTMIVLSYLTSYPLTHIQSADALRKCT